MNEWSDMDHTEAGLYGYDSTRSAAEQRRLGFPNLAAAHEAQADEIEEHGA